MSRSNPLSRSLTRVLSRPLDGFSAGFVGPIQASFISGQSVSGAVANTNYNWTGLDFGDESEYRVIVAQISQRSLGEQVSPYIKAGVTAMTIGGVSGTEIFYAYPGGTNGCSTAWWAAVVPTGTTGQAINWTTWTGLPDNDVDGWAYFSMQAWRLVGADIDSALVDSYSNFDNGTNPASVPISVVEGGVILGTKVSYRTGTVTTAGVNEDLTVTGTNWQVTSGHVVAPNGSDISCQITNSVPNNAHSAFISIPVL